MKKCIPAILATLLTLASSILHASLIDDRETVEALGIFVRGITICHQREWRNLTVNLEYNTDIGNNTTDIQAIKERIRRFLDEYANPDDFWEVMNTNLVLSLSASYPDITTIKSTLSLSQDRTLQFPRESIVRFEKGSDNLKESFSFTKLNYPICQESFHSLDLRVSWDLKANPDPSSDYPDYQWVNDAMHAFFKEHPVSISEWKTLKPLLIAYLIEQFPSVSTMDVEITIAE